MKKIVIFMALILLSSFVVADNTTLNTTGEEVANCSEQIIRCIDEYNNLLKDFREGINCGTATLNLKYMNEYLIEERDNCREEVGKIKVYQTGIYIFFILLIMIAVGHLFQAIKKKKR